MKKFFIAMSVFLMIIPMCVMPMKKQLTSVDHEYSLENIPLLLNAMPRVENFAYNNFEINVQSKDDIEEHTVNLVNLKENCSILKQDGDNNRSELVLEIDNLGTKNEDPLINRDNRINLGPLICMGSTVFCWSAFLISGIASVLLYFPWKGGPV